MIDTGITLVKVSKTTIMIRIISCKIISNRCKWIRRGSDRGCERHPGWVGAWRSAMLQSKLRTVLGTQGPTAALKDGLVRPVGFEFDFDEEVTDVIGAFRMVRNSEFDVCEMALSTYLCAREHGKRFTALPVFLVRAFHHSAILVRRDNSARSPKALEGQRVGVAGGYTTTTGLWARALLQEEHGVDLGRVTWVLSGDEHVAEYRAPANVVSAGGRKLVDLLLEGEIDALIGTGVDHPAVVPLVPDGLQACKRCASGATTPSITSWWCAMSCWTRRRNWLARCSRLSPRPNACTSNICARHLLHLERPRNSCIAQ